MTTSAAWVGLRAAFGNPYMEAILNCRVPRTLNKILEKMFKLKTGGEAAYQELSMKDGKRDKEIVSTRLLLPHKEILCFIERPPVFTRPSRTRREMGAKELGQ